MKNLKNNYGVTLLELVVAIAILALLGTAIVGIMGSNTSIFRKNKADIKIQTSAEETYNTISEDIMQAKYIYIEGYASADTIPFDDLTMEIGKNLTSVGGGVSPSLTRIGLLKTSDQYLIDLAGANPGISSDVCQVYTDRFTNTTGTDTRSSVYENYYNSLSTVDKAKADELFNSLLYMDKVEAYNYGCFLDYVVANQDTAISNYTSFDSDTVVDKSSKPYIYKNIYITKIIIGSTAYLDPKDPSLTTTQKDRIKYYDPGTNTDANDFCISVYEFNGPNITYSSSYYVNDNKNTSGASDQIYSKKLNYVQTDDGDISAALINVDGKNESLALKMYFNDKNRTYKSDGMTYLRNSYVLHDAK